ncbi:MAG: hypothetical protein MHM6MM_002714 [Cercozoa sp. M6MM]
MRRAAALWVNSWVLRQVCASNLEEDLAHLTDEAIEFWNIVGSQRIENSFVRDENDANDSERDSEHDSSSSEDESDYESDTDDNKRRIRWLRHEWMPADMIVRGYRSNAETKVNTQLAQTLSSCLSDLLLNKRVPDSVPTVCCVETLDDMYRSKMTKWFLFDPNGADSQVRLFETAHDFDDGMFRLKFAFLLREDRRPEGWTVQKKSNKVWATPKRVRRRHRRRLRQFERRFLRSVSKLSTLPCFR